MNKRLSVGVNGFGRFGKHLLRYWALNYRHANFNIDYINDDRLSLVQAYNLIVTDKYLTDLAKCITLEADGLRIDLPDLHHKIAYTNSLPEQIPWLGAPDLVMEASGKLTGPDQHRQFIKGNTERVLISASSIGVDQTLIYGYNHNSYDPGSKTISYGSCTVNAYVPLAACLHRLFGIADSDVNIIHNVPEYKLAESKTPQRKACTLSFMGPMLLPFLNNDNFQVNYTNIPYSGVSSIDFRFRLAKTPSKPQIAKLLAEEIKYGGLKVLYDIVDRDNGPERHKFTDYSAVFVAPSIRLKGDNLYMQAYFDNENSVNRYFDIANFLAGQAVSEITYGR